MRFDWLFAKGVIWMVMSCMTGSVSVVSVCLSKSRAVSAVRCGWLVIEFVRFLGGQIMVRSGFFFFVLIVCFFLFGCGLGDGVGVSVGVGLIDGGVIGFDVDVEVGVGFMDGVLDVESKLSDMLDANTLGCTVHIDCDDGIECMGDVCIIEGVCTYE